MKSKVPLMSDRPTLSPDFKTKIVRLESIHHCLTGLIVDHAFNGAETKKLYAMRDTIEKMLKPFEGVSVYDESDSVGC